MKLNSVTLTKTYKIGLPNYSNITVGVSMSWEVAEGEQFEFDKGWDVINQQLDIQAQNGTDPSWIKTDEYKKHYSTTIRSVK